jgi:AraC-like DNA-binding protein
MIRGTKSMIAGCIDKARHGDCGTCAKKDACSDFFSGLFGPGGAFSKPRPHRPEPRRERPAPRERHPFRLFLGDIVKVIETHTTPKAQPSALRRQVEATIEPLLPAGDAAIERVARALGLSRQTLYRRLKEEGTTFEALLDGVRRRLAIELIREGASVKDAAYRLGFSDPAAFSRAFKRWTGSSPSTMGR